MVLLFVHEYNMLRVLLLLLFNLDIPYLHHSLFVLNYFLFLLLFLPNLLFLFDTLNCFLGHFLSKNICSSDFNIPLFLLLLDCFLFLPKFQITIHYGMKCHTLEGLCHVFSWHLIFGWWLGLHLRH